jgi:hypothetical protein
MPNIMVREQNAAGVVMSISRIPSVGEYIKTQLGRELRITRVTHTPFGAQDAEVDVSLA